jgi:hypothetical protein
MKTMMKMIVKMAAKWLLGFLPNAAVWAVKYGTDKTKDRAKAAFVLSVVKNIATDAAMIARIMEDGKVEDVEVLAVESRAEALAEELQGLL